MHQINLSTHWGKLVGPYGKTCMVGLCKKIMKLMWLGRKMSLADRQKKRNWCELRRKESLHRECSGYSKKTRQYHCPTLLKLSHIFRANCNDLEMVPEIINMEANCNDLGKGSRPLVPTQDVRAGCHILLDQDILFDLSYMLSQSTIWAMKENFCLKIYEDGGHWGVSDLVKYFDELAYT